MVHRWEEVLTNAYLHPTAVEDDFSSAKLLRFLAEGLPRWVEHNVFASYLHVGYFYFLQCMHTLKPMLHRLVDTPNTGE